MMYNPYNWNIRTSDGKILAKKDKKMTPKPQLVYNCILNELGYVGNDIDALRIKRIRLEKELTECDEEIIKLEQKKLHLINKLSETP